MDNQANVSMLVQRALEQAEKTKIERLDGAISEKFRCAGLVARLCQASGTGEERVLRFFSDIVGVAEVGSVRSEDFLRLPEAEAIAKISLANR
jgi:hypothetical protein